MKKLLFVMAAIVAMSFVSCGQVTSVEPVNDSIADSIVDSTVVDTCTVCDSCISCK